LASRLTAAVVDLELKKDTAGASAGPGGGVAKLNATYPHRGVIKTAALHKTESDQKFTIDLSEDSMVGTY
jgi:hypothetical protein